MRVLEQVRFGLLQKPMVVAKFALFDPDPSSIIRDEIERFMTVPESSYELVEPVGALAVGGSTPPTKSSWSDWGFLLMAGLLCGLHGWLMFVAMGKWVEISSDLPLLQGDHGIHYRHGLLTSQFLKSSGTTAGYDPGFMSGYPMSIISDLSSTFSDLVMLSAGNRPAFGYKIHVLGCSALVPWLMGLAAFSWKARPQTILITILLYFIYFWTDFPYKYASLGMLNYLLSIPLGLLAVSGLSAYVEKGGFWRWLWALLASALVFLVHLTSPLIVGPAGLLAYLVGVFQARRGGTGLSWSRHAGFWLIGPLILALNAFWCLPGYLLRSTLGETGIAFSHSSESVFQRLFEIVWMASPSIEVVSLGLAPLGIVALGRRSMIGAVGLGGFLVAGFSWGYLAGWWPALDGLQPGRHTYACYSAACVTAAIGLGETFKRLQNSRAGRLDVWLAVGLILASVHVFGPPLLKTIRSRVFENPFLSSREVPRVVWVVQNVQKHLKPGERLLFEETGLGVAGLVDPFSGRHCSAILPSVAGVEVLGGPFLHTTVTTNFTQFGENKLFGKTDWGRDDFIRYAGLYRPSAICCWSPQARAFCEANPDLIKILETDGTLVLGRVLGFEGPAIFGSARVEASPNLLVVSDLVEDNSGKGEGMVVLRYHWVPFLQADPMVEIVPVKLEDDPVPFIGLRPTAHPVTIRMVLPLRGSAPQQNAVKGAP